MQQQLIAGDSLNFLTKSGDYPATAGWVLKFRLVPRASSNLPIGIISAAEGSDFRTTAPASETAQWAADDYSWTSWVERADEVYSVDSGQITVKPNPRTVGAGYDGRSLARKALEDAKAALAAWKPTQRRYKIGEREMEFNSTAEIVKAISYWEAEAQREDRAARLAAGLPDRRKSYVRLSRG
jgi:hypothetical protein